MLIQDVVYPSAVACLQVVLGLHRLPSLPIAVQVPHKPAGGVARAVRVVYKLLLFFDRAEMNQYAPI